MTAVRLGALAEWLLSHRRSILFLLVLLVIAGGFAAIKMPVSLFPAVSFPRIVVSLEAGDRSADQMQMEVTIAVEQALRSVQGVVAINSTTSRGSADVDLRFNWGSDLPQKVLQVQAAMAQISSTLPPGVTFAVKRMDPTKFPVVAYSLTSSTVDPVALRRFAQLHLVPALSSIPGVRQVGLQGGAMGEYRVTVNPAKLAALNLSMQEVVQALSAANTLQAVGKLQARGRLDLLLADGRFATLDEVRQTILRTGVNGVIRLDEVASVHAAQAPQFQIVTANGKPAVLLQVHQTLGGNTVAIDRAVAAQLEAMQAQFPADVHLARWYDQSTVIEDSVNSVRDAILLGIVFATLVLLGFLRSIKLALMTLVLVPTVLSATILLLSLLGMSFNIMTLGGMAAAVGLIVDDIIVMLEQITRRLHEAGHEKHTVMQAAHDFTQPLAGSSTATIIIFAPLAFLDGVTGAFFKALSLTMATALIVSFLFVWLALPLIADKLLSARDAETKESGRVLGGVLKIYRQLMHFLLTKPLSILPIIALVIAIGGFALGKVPSGFMPEMNEGGFVLDYQTAPGTSLIETDRLVSQVERILAATPEVSTWTRRTGTQLGGGLTEANQGDMFILLKSPEGQSAVMNRLADQITQEVPGFQLLDMNQPMQDLIGDLSGSPRPVVVVLSGADWPTLQALAPKVAAALGQVAGLKEINDGLVFAGGSVDIKINHVKAALEGLTPSDITQQLGQFLHGAIATQIREGQQMLGVRVWIPAADRDSLFRIEQLMLRAPDGHLVPLKRVAVLTRTEGAAEITRHDLTPAVSVSARIDGRGFSAAIHDVRQALATPGLLPAGVHYQLAGLYLQQQQAFAGLIQVFIAAALLVFLALLFLYEQFRMALAIMVAPLLAVGGVFTGLWLAGQTLNITALMGMIMIVGIVTEVAVFYFSELAVLRQNHRGAAHPLSLSMLIDAGSNRMRPILMTTLAAILALLPLGLGIGQGSAMQQPLAIAIISGLVIQMPLVLIVMPVMYRLLLGRQAFARDS
ncbi:MAG: transporter [Halothiobacillus sp. 24-54-40]|jgi:multidrug efflux pump subunit AcrB|nr:MAG: transporter [Halothiobacillus sp. 35-54-62]OYZ86131.1 MAG: transporter [Halothiobacillus sp. 24-54-40]OZA79812.1 MAG: transporter [Halothiobacillus sp. 39-53-45]HQS03035.1 efflux RND transporter permease subunit [Halothiobacillus sp.]HQS29549.1 efflux RND transporter permease subunit [Halothiobacillus sp.]